MQQSFLNQIHKIKVQTYQVYNFKKGSTLFKKSFHDNTEMTE